ncbi:unnamed protein product, partial [Didymodactylos carnosus]
MNVSQQSKSAADEIKSKQHQPSHKYRTALIILTVLILIAAVFISIIIYKALKTGAEKDRFSNPSAENETNDQNQTVQFRSNQDRSRSLPSCQNGICKHGATCTEQRKCVCLFNCSETDRERVCDQNGDIYKNQCFFEQSKCKHRKDTHLIDAKTCREKLGAMRSSCSSMTCLYGGSCEEKIDENGALYGECICPDNCNEYVRVTIDDKSVCATNNETYNSLCELNKEACQQQQNFTLAYYGTCDPCRDYLCTYNSECGIDADGQPQCKCGRECSTEYRPLCASNYQMYDNECEMNKYACQMKIKLHKLNNVDAENLFFSNACINLRCMVGKICVYENGIASCRCPQNCTHDIDNPVCGSNRIIYRNQCEMERVSCEHGETIYPIELENCVNSCENLRCPYGQCSVKNGLASCDCAECSSEFADYTQEQDLICADNGYTYTSQCQLEFDSCTKNSLISPKHAGRCNNCWDVRCPFNGICQTIQGNYTCTCKPREECQWIDRNPNYRVCASNRHYYSNQCEIDVASCELQTELYLVDQRYCEEQLEYGSAQCNVRECGRYYGRCIDDVCTCPDCTSVTEREEMCATNRQTYDNRCLIEKESCEHKVKIEPEHVGPCSEEPDLITALVPYKLCINDSHCGTNMVCLSGICECKEQSYLPALKKRECFKPLQSMNSSCHYSLFGCCSDGVTPAPGYEKRGCPERCACNQHGSSASTCDPYNGVCYCKPAVGGPTCSNCENNYWGFSRLISTNNTGCIPCGCNPFGSVRQDCFQGNGSCACKPYTTGRTCDKCKEHGLALTEHGCVDRTYMMTHQRSCRDIQCKYDSICQLELGRPVCKCDIYCNEEDERPMDICASDGRTYSSKCQIKRQQCRKQYEIIPIYPGVCVATDDERREYLTDDDYSTTEYHPALIESINPVRRTIVGACTRRTPCENNSTCQDKPNGNYICLCGWQWQGRHCEERFQVTIPRFNGHSYFELKSFENIRQLKLDLIFESNRLDGLILYSGDAEKISEHFFMIALRNGQIDITIRVDYMTEPIQISQLIRINTYVHLKIIISNGEIKVQINDGNITSKLLPFHKKLNQFSVVYLGALPDSLRRVYDQLRLRSGFDGCIQEFRINNRLMLFNSTQHNAILSAQNIDEPYVGEFSKQSYIKHPPLKPKNGGEFLLEFWFLTQEYNGILLYSVGIQEKTHLLLHLQGGLLTLNVLLLTQTIAIRSRYPVELLKWHRCILRIYGQKFSLYVNNEVPVDGYAIFAKSALWPRKPTYFGGVPQGKLSDELHGLHGAIQKIILNGKPLIDIRQNALELSNVTQYRKHLCYPDKCINMKEICFNNYADDRLCQST